ncbi:hypothetical protein Pcac1_g13174 [Phytophthora cactorum]|nr:hypothetical protein Pcac1_g13174 [Phytophthora cactorum]
MSVSRNSGTRTGVAIGVSCVARCSFRKRSVAELKNVCSLSGSSPGRAPTASGGSVVASS